MYELIIAVVKSAAGRWRPRLSYRSHVTCCSTPAAAAHGTSWRCGMNAAGTDADDMAPLWINICAVCHGVVFIQTNVTAD